MKQLIKFKEEIKDKTIKELLALRKAIMDSWNNDEDNSNDSIFDLLNDIEIKKTEIIEEAIMRINTPSGEITIEYTNGTIKKIKL